MAGLVDRPHWARVCAILKMVSFQVHVMCTALEEISPMARKRLFMFFTSSDSTFSVPTVNLSPKNWCHIGCGTLPGFLEEQTALTPRQVQMLSKRCLLPKSQRSLAFQEGIPDGPLVLRKRQVSHILPTLVASYRRQCDLPAASLATKGVLTWLVPGALGLRY